MDLAARNVLLTHDKIAKVADFGLSTRIYIHTSERKGSKQDVVPVQWTAYEVLKNKGATIEFSDVWSFGVLMWEIFHLGSAFPYGDVSDFREIIKSLENGERLGKPPMCPKYIYDLMLECWMLNHMKRPTFYQLKNKLQNDTERYSSPVSTSENCDKITYLDMSATTELYVERK